jgi:hypothetical protein
MATINPQAMRIAARHTVAEIEAMPCITDVTGARWHDTRPSVDKYHHAPQVVELAEEVIDCALRNGWAERHRNHAWMLRITPTGCEAANEAPPAADAPWFEAKHPTLQQ